MLVSVGGGTKIVIDASVAALEFSAQERDDNTLPQERIVLWETINKEGVLEY